ncbi:MULTISPECIES: hypothetical protein [unclassified Bradyrhizobium]|uniref:hypothetical protein n=1 Tax=unclassified Bradyrhizobium TaxID=2631580 RepID=UPI0028EAB010|nr:MULTISPECIES: hypothetical protein [unclassified Bradyrhizobium]
MPLYQATARAVMRPGLQNFTERIAHALAISVDEARELARGILDEPASDQQNSTEDSIS